jgi:hypothetical protein
MNESLTHVIYYHILLFNLSINKEVMTSELLSNYTDYSEIIYLLLLLKLKEDNTVEKYSKFLIINNDNLIVWAEALMDATLMNTMLTKKGANAILLGKIQDILKQLISEQELLLNAQYMVQNL